MNTQKERVVINRASDGEFMCVYGTEETRTAPGLELLPAEGPKGVKATFPKAEPLSLFECIWIGFICALVIAWDILTVLIVLIAVIVAAVLVGVSIGYLTANG